MLAMSKEFHMERPADLDQHPHLYRKALNTELNEWGRWIERNWDYEGFPTASPSEAYRMGRGGGCAGHRVLCLDMPDRVYAVHGRILLLAEELRDAVWIWFVPRLKLDGTVWSIAERCRLAGISEELLRQRVKRAKDRILGL